MKIQGLGGKKGQVKMIETTVVLLAFVFLFAMFFIFYARFQLFEIDKIAKQVEEERAKSIINKITAMPELQCTLSFGDASGINCIDTLKLLAFSRTSQNAEEFTKLSEVRIVKLFPSPPPQTSQMCETFTQNYPKNCAEWKLKKADGKSRISFDSYVALCTPRSAGAFECEIGRVIVSVPRREV